MQDVGDGNVRTWDGDPGPQGHWLISVNPLSDETTFRMVTMKWPNWYMYMQDKGDGNVRGWEEDPGEQGWFILRRLRSNKRLTVTPPQPTPVISRMAARIDGYHQTSQENMERIQAGGDTFCPGNGGMLGAAMYFAVTPEDTFQKAHNGGWIAHCRVDPGRCMMTEQWHPNMTKQELNAKGFDSIYVQAGGAASAPEYAIFDAERIEIVKWSRAT
eukprot:gnl/TRDRNA2_/TRDRNA2_123232_c1_seq1.p1 gnl/TRDRNA2_/TRDRNA2_123232_c1~~gnl/TRDRNA2_/TRDRNA2_123232_c1_seq1.p1  ORF type:complete len:223 (+),score=30.37 gnl/TRDRNA2_/TRDRNA2_123232_c1_seq1:26-670(+)